MLTVKALEDRRDILKVTLTECEVSLSHLMERKKILAKEIANIKGAVIELDRLIDGVGNHG